MDRNSTIKRNKRYRLQISDLLAILVLAIIAFSLVMMALRYIRYLSLDICSVEHRTVMAEQEAQVIFLRSEYPITAGYEGSFTPTVSEGERVKGAEQIGYIQWENQQQHPVLSPHTGIISYNLDGWESLLTPELAENTDWLSVLSHLEEEKPEAVPTAELSANRVVAKVVDNLIEPTLFFRTDSLPENLAEGEVCKFLLPGDNVPQQPLQAVVREIGWLADGSCYFLAQLRSVDSRMYTERASTVSLIDRSVSGNTIPVSALQWNEAGSEAFVYRCEYKRLAKVKVDVLYQDEQMAVVDGLTVGDSIIANAERAKEGQRIYIKR